MLFLKEIDISYGPVKAVTGLNMKIKEGEIVALLGSNGAGKTTTIKTISGIIKPSNGEIQFEEKNITKLVPEKIVELGVVQVPEGRYIFPQLTVIENLSMGCYFRDLKDKKFQEEITKIYELFPKLKERSAQKGGTLSGGEQQMLAIGRGLMGNPKLLMLDEPSLGIAPILVETIFEKIKEINKNGTTILLVEQNVNLALEVAHRGYVLENGNLALEGTAEELLQATNIHELYLGKTS